MGEDEGGKKEMSLVYYRQGLRQRLKVLSIEEMLYTMHSTLLNALNCSCCRSSKS